MPHPENLVPLILNENNKPACPAASISLQEEKTIAYYDQNAHKWSEHYDLSQKTSFWVLELQLFNKLFVHGSLLEIGVGGAGEAAFFIEKGYAYTGIDPTQGIVECAQKKFPQATFIKQNVYDLNGSPRFDAFWCSAVLLHIPPQNIDLALSAIKRVLKPGALGFISIAQRHGEYGKEYYDAFSGRYFYLYEQEEFIEYLKRNGFLVEKHDIRSHATHSGWLTSWLTFFVRTEKKAD